jgi:hypothetical protein
LAADAKGVKDERLEDARRQKGITDNCGVITVLAMMGSAVLAACQPETPEIEYNAAGFNKDGFNKEGYNAADFLMVFTVFV